MFDKKLTIVHLFVKTLTNLGQGQILDKCWTKLGQILDIRPKFVQHLSGHPFYKSTEAEPLFKSYKGNLFRSQRRENTDQDPRAKVCEVLPIHANYPESKKF